MESRQKGISINLEIIKKVSGVIKFKAVHANSKGRKGLDLIFFLYLKRINSVNG